MDAIQKKTEKNGVDALVFAYNAKKVIEENETHLKTGVRITIPLREHVFERLVTELKLIQEVGEAFGVLITITEEDYIRQEYGPGWRGFDVERKKETNKHAERYIFVVKDRVGHLFFLETTVYDEEEKQLLGNALRQFNFGKIDENECEFLKRLNKETQHNFKAFKPDCYVQYFNGLGDCFPTGSFCIEWQ
jgi:hypothetical protein